MAPPLLAWLALSALTAHGASLSCRAKLEGDLRSGGAKAAACFTAKATWSDASGQVPVAEGLKAWLATRPLLPSSGLLEVRSSSTVFLIGTRTPGNERPRYLVLAVDASPAGWTAARLYSAAAPWPAAPTASPSRNPADLRSVLDGFNSRFSAGDVAGWLEYWHRDGIWDSSVRRFSGPGIAEFFKRQAARYAGPRLTVQDKTTPQAPGFLLEGKLSARCRAAGKPFEIPVLMLLRVEQRRLRYGWEAVIEKDDGCGPYWDGPAASR